MTSVTSAGILNAAVARVSAARNDITAAEAPQERGEAANGWRNLHITPRYAMQNINSSITKISQDSGL